MTRDESMNDMSMLSRVFREIVNPNCYPKIRRVKRA